MTRSSLNRLAWSSHCCRGLISSLALVLLAACATPPPTTPPATDAGPVVSGKISVRIAPINDGQGHSVSALFDLRSQSGQSGQLELSSPLGTLMGRASWAPGYVVLTTPQWERAYPDLAALSEDLLGEPVPLQALFDWIHGRPWPQANSAPLPAPVVGFSQLGWLIKLDRLGDGVIVAERPDPPSITVVARRAP